jgi:hypothetical protein
MSGLERRCRLLMRAYPAQYRRERGDEMLGTLLEAIPEGRSWPPLRDVRALLAGGLRARAVPRRRLPLRANLRIAVFVGLAAYLGSDAVARMSFDAGAAGRLGGWSQLPWAFGWAAIVAPPLMLTAVVVAWVTRRRLVALAAALPAAVAECYASGHVYGGNEWGAIWWGGVIIPLVWLACLVALAGGDERPGRGWLVLVGPVVLSPVLGAGGAGAALTLVVAVVLAAVGVVSLAWIVVDARPAIAVGVFSLATSLPGVVGNSALAFSLVGDGLPLLALAAVTAAALWLMRRQSAGFGRRQA